MHFTVKYEDVSSVRSSEYFVEEFNVSWIYHIIDQISSNQLLKHLTFFI